MSQALYRKWRPKEWEQVVAQEHVIQTLRNAIAAGRVAHAYLFAGPRGTGKTTTARLLAKAVNCLAEGTVERPCNQCAHCQSVIEGRFLDLIEIDAASNTSVEDVRDLREKINFSPTQGKYKVYIIDEVHMLSTAAFNALLKTLEEPPPHAIFVLATTEIHKIPATVLSRCQRHEFRRIPVQDITRYLKDLADQEGLEVEPEALTLIARQSTGAMRDAISLLDQLSSTGKMITLEMAQTVLGTATASVVIDLISAVAEGDASAGLGQIHRALDAGSDPRQFARQVTEYLRGLLLLQMGSAEQVEAPLETRMQMKRHADALSRPRLMQALRAFNSAALNDHRGNWQPGLPVELAFAESLETPVALAAPVVYAAAEAPAVQARAAANRPAAPSSEPEPQPAGRREQPAAAGERIQAVSQTSARAEASLAGEPGAATSGTTLSFPTLTQEWPRIRALIKKHSPQTEALLNSCKLQGVKDGALLLAFSPLLKQKMETGNHLDITSRAIVHITGMTVLVRCVLGSGKGESKIPTDAQVEDDGIVGTALRDLGGEVVDFK